MDFYFEDRPSTSQYTLKKGSEDTQMVIYDYILRGKKSFKIVKSKWEYTNYTRYMYFVFGLLTNFSGEKMAV